MGIFEIKMSFSATKTMRLPNHASAIIQNSTKKSVWILKYKGKCSEVQMMVYQEPVRAFFTHGWEEFVDSHNFQVGDRLRFEVVNYDELVMEVKKTKALKYLGSVCSL